MLLSNRFKAMLVRLTFKCASKHAKRIFFITSLHSQFNEYQKHSSVTVKRLNSVMKLAMREDALGYPESVSSLVWKDCGLEHILSDQVILATCQDGQVNNLAKEILDVAPKWTLYANRSKMIEDLSSWIRNQRNFMAWDLRETVIA